jgi:glutaredoxin
MHASVTARFIFSFAVILTASGIAVGQESRRPERQKESIRRGAIDFWGDRTRNAARGEKPEGGESLWGESSIDADARAPVHVPPQVVREFLDHPSRETALAYVAGQRKRMARLKVAVELLEQLRMEAAAEKESPPTRSGNDARSPADAKDGVRPSARVVFFSQPGCPWCERQEAALAELAERHRDLSVERPAADDPRWKELGVTSTPTLVLTSSSGRTAVVRGYTSADALGKLLAEGRDVGK